MAINASGQIVGSSNYNQTSSTHAFRTNNAGLLDDLGTLGGSDSAALSINYCALPAGRRT